MNDEITSMEAFASAMLAVITRLVEALEPVARAFQTAGFFPDELPPQHSYRQTRYGRLPRLTPAMRKRQRDMRIRGGRR